MRGQWTRAFSSATLVGFGGLGGIVSSLVFREQDAPGYRPGMYAAIAYVSRLPYFWVILMLTDFRCNLLIIIIALVLSLWFRICNKKADRGERVIEGDVAFRYTI